MANTCIKLCKCLHSDEKGAVTLEYLITASAVCAGLIGIFSLFQIAFKSYLSLIFIIIGLPVP